MRYRTIVADPPWRYRGTMIGHLGRRTDRRGTPYPTMTLDEIAALPVQAMADSDAHLYLWTTNTHLRYAWDIVEAWGFRYSTLLTWCKTPRGLVGGAAYTGSNEFVLFARRGTLAATGRMDSTWFNWKRPEVGTGPMLSRKPDGFLDVVEQVSPGPYLELFARRERLGWDTWGNESLGTAELAS